MNNLKKIGLTALGTSLIATSAYAGALSVSGGASITFAGNDLELVEMIFLWVIV